MNTAHFSGIVDLQIMVDKLDILAGDKTPALLFNFVLTDAAVKLRYGIICAVGSFGLPCVINVGGFLNLFAA